MELAGLFWNAILEFCWMEEFQTAIMQLGTAEWEAQMYFIGMVAPDDKIYYTKFSNLLFGVTLPSANLGEDELAKDR